jgi:hypothetical protein
MNNYESRTEGTSAPGRRRAIIAAVIGNALEWYDEERPRIGVLPQRIGNQL